MNIRKFVHSIAAAFALTLFASSSWGAVLSLDPSSQSVAAGTPVSVDLIISGLGNGDAPALSGYTGLQIAYDDTILQPIDVAFTSRLGDVTDPFQVVYSVNTFFPGFIGLDQVSLLDAATLFGLQTTPSGSFVLATLTFNTIAAGNSALTISAGVLSDELGNTISATTQNGSVLVTGGSPVPEPSTLLLLTAGLGAIVVRRRR